MSELRWAIETEIYTACRRLGAGWDILPTIRRRSGLYKACQDLGAGVELLSIIGSYGDTISDADVLTFLRAYNAGKPIIVDLICSIEGH